jgi:hypothetical protein
VTLEVWEGMCHVFQSHDPLLPEAREAIAHIARFLRSGGEQIGRERGDTEMPLRGYWGPLRGMGCSSVTSHAAGYSGWPMRGIFLPPNMMVSVVLVCTRASGCVSSRAVPVP